jgi:hypothetical protein
VGHTRLFAEKVLPAVQAMPTPMNPASLGYGDVWKRVSPELLIYYP